MFPKPHLARHLHAWTSTLLPTANDYAVYIVDNPKPNIRMKQLATDGERDGVLELVALA
jgi:hypothetical protein